MAQEGFHWEATISDDWRLVTSDERHRTCRRPTCNEHPVAALNRKHRRNSGVSDCWWVYCAEHLYGNWIEGGEVMHWRLIKDEHAEANAADRPRPKDAN